MAADGARGDAGGAPYRRWREKRRTRGVDNGGTASNRAALLSAGARARRRRSSPRGRSCQQPLAAPPLIIWRAGEHTPRGRAVAGRAARRGGREARWTPSWPRRRNVRPQRRRTQRACATRLTPPARAAPGGDAPLSAQNKREIGSLAVWSVTSAKPGHGVECMRDNSTESYWQCVRVRGVRCAGRAHAPALTRAAAWRPRSDGAQPHVVSIAFQRKVELLVRVPE